MPYRCPLNGGNTVAHFHLDWAGDGNVRTCPCGQLPFGSVRLSAWIRVVRTQRSRQVSVGFSFMDRIGAPSRATAQSQPRPPPWRESGVDYRRKSIARRRRMSCGVIERAGAPPPNDTRLECRTPEARIAASVCSGLVDVRPASMGYACVDCASALISRSRRCTSSDDIYARGAVMSRVVAEQPVGRMLRS